MHQFNAIKIKKENEATVGNCLKHLYYLYNHYTGKIDENYTFIYFFFWGGGGLGGEVNPSCWGPAFVALTRQTSEYPTVFGQSRTSSLKGKVT